MSQGRVLLVEDNDDLRFFHGNMIREWGYEVIAWRQRSGENEKQNQRYFL